MQSVGKAKGENLDSLGLGGFGTTGGLWAGIGIWGWKVWIKGLFSSTFTVSWRLCKRDSRKYDWILLGFIYVCLRSDSELDLNTDLWKLVSHSKFWKLWNSLENNPSVWEVFILSLPSLRLINIYGFFTPYKISEEGLPIVSVLLEARIYFLKICLKWRWSRQGKCTTDHNARTFFFPQIFCLLES